MKLVEDLSRGRNVFRRLRSGGTPLPVHRFEVAPLGDSALLLRVGSSQEDPNREIASLLQARDQIEAAAVPGIIEVVIGYASVAVFFDPVVTTRAGAPLEGISDWLATRLKAVLNSPQIESQKVSAAAAIEIPVCYDLEFAIDLDHIARHAGLPAGEVIRLHSQAEYCVRCVGFTPGFPYLSGLREELTMPRRSTPRKNVPAGAVAIGGKQTGIYPAGSPGGWNVIGRTPLKLFDPRLEPPALLHAGDQVRFRPITREEFFGATT